MIRTMAALPRLIQHLQKARSIGPRQSLIVGLASQPRRQPTTVAPTRAIAHVAMAVVEEKPAIKAVPATTAVVMAAL
jgi:hypothetical protein